MGFSLNAGRCLKTEKIEVIINFKDGKGEGTREKTKVYLHGDIEEMAVLEVASDDRIDIRRGIIGEMIRSRGAMQLIASKES